MPNSDQSTAPVEDVIGEWIPEMQRKRVKVNRQDARGMLRVLGKLDSNQDL